MDLGKVETEFGSLFLLNSNIFASGGVSYKHISLSAPVDTELCEPTPVLGGKDTATGALAIELDALWVSSGPICTQPFE